MATIKFLGAAQEVTGSCHMLESPAFGRILLDCGMHQGGSSVHRIVQEHFLFDPSSVDAVVLSHALLDHSGMLPKLAHKVSSAQFTAPMRPLTYCKLCCWTRLVFTLEI
jgi:metallo-beta-lactamase family protein